MKNVIGYIKRKIGYAIGAMKYDWDYLGVLNSPFKGLQLEWYWGEIGLGLPYFLPRRLVKMTREDCVKALQDDIDRRLPKYVEGRDETYYKNHKKFVPIKHFGFNYITLGWKTKWDDFRFEWAPRYSLVIFGRQLCVTIKPRIKEVENRTLLEDIYWEAWLNYKHKTDKTKSKVERLQELMENFSCTYITYGSGENKNERTEVDYFPQILKAKYL